MKNKEERFLIHIPKDANYIEILGHRIDGFESFEAFCEHLKKYADLEETINRQKAEIERLQRLGASATRRMLNARDKAIKEFADSVLNEIGEKMTINTTDQLFIVGQCAGLIGVVRDRMVGGGNVQL